MKFYRCGKEASILAYVSTTARPANDKPVEELKPNTVDAAQEKHVPVITQEGQVVTVQVGSTIHPMTEEHYIVFIAIETTEGLQIKYLHPGDTPRVSFALTEGDKLEAAYEYCNLHGLWKAEV
jgi:superoxide reductase